MIRIDLDRVIQAPVADVWASWDAFGDIKAFNPNINDSFLLPGSSASGLGARRRCNLDTRGNHIVEQIVGYTPERQMIIEIKEGTVPIRDARLTLDLEAEGAAATRVRLQIQFQPKLGFLSPLLAPLMRRQFTGAMKKLLAGNAAMVEAQVAEATAAA